MWTCKTNRIIYILTFIDCKKSFPWVFPDFSQISRFSRSAPNPASSCFISGGKFSQISGLRNFISSVPMKTLCTDGIWKSACFHNWQGTASLNWKIFHFWRTYTSGGDHAASIGYLWQLVHGGETWKKYKCSWYMGVLGTKC